MNEVVQLALITLVSAEAMDDDIVSSVADVKNCRSYALQAVWTDDLSAQGTLTVNASLDGVTYTAIASSVITTGSGSYLLNVELPAYNYLRVNYTQASGDGTLTVKINLKS
jgi:hypothetical protein